MFDTNFQGMQKNDQDKKWEEKNFLKALSLVFDKF